MSPARRKPPPLQSASITQTFKPQHKHQLWLHLSRPGEKRAPYPPGAAIPIRGAEGSAIMPDESRVESYLENLLAENEASDIAPTENRAIRTILANSAALGSLRKDLERQLPE